MSCGPRTAAEKIICGAGAIPKGEYMDGTRLLAGGSLQPGQAHINELALADAGLFWVLFVLGPRDADGPAGSTRWPFSSLGFRGVRRWRTTWKRRTAGV